MPLDFQINLEFLLLFLSLVTPVACESVIMATIHISSVCLLLGLFFNIRPVLNTRPPHQYFQKWHHLWPKTTPSDKWHQDRGWRQPSTKLFQPITFLLNLFRRIGKLPSPFPFSTLCIPSCWFHPKTCPNRLYGPQEEELPKEALDPREYARWKHSNGTKLWYFIQSMHSLSCGPRSHR